MKEGGMTGSAKDFVVNEIGWQLIAMNGQSAYMQ
jgi:hypothetical protein